jgi:hypothetical protein
VIKQAVDDQAHDLGQPKLDGIRILEGGQGYRQALGDKLVDIELLLKPQVVKMTMLFIAEGGRSALRPVDFNVLTATNTYWI